MFIVMIEKFCLRLFFFFFSEKKAVKRIVLFGIFIGLWFCVFYKPTINRLYQFQEDKTRLDNELKVIEGAIFSIPSLYKEVETVRNELQVISQRIPMRSGFPEILVEIKKHGKMVGLNFVNISPEHNLLFSNSVAPGETFTVPIYIEMTGSYFQFGRFLEKLDGVPFIIHSEKVAMSSQDSISGKLQIKTTLLVLFQA